MRRGPLFTENGSIISIIIIKWIDALESSFGNLPMAKLDVTNATFTETMGSSGVYILNGNTAQTSGRLAGIEYMAVSAGSVKIGVSS